MAETTELHKAILEGRFAVERVPEVLPVEVLAVESSVPPGRSPLDVVTPSRLVGREQELAFLHECWQGAQAGHGALVLIRGEAGVGKTRLVEEFAGHLRWQGVRVLWGRCYEFERLLPYQPVAEALRTIRPSLTPAGLADFPAWTVAEVARLVPEMSEQYPDLTAPASIGSDQEQARLFNGVAHFLATLSSHGALLIVLEDLHWVTESTLQLVHYLARQLADYPVLMVGTLRPEAVGRRHPLWDLQRQLSRKGLARPLRLPRLSSEAVEALVVEMSGAGEAVVPLAGRLSHETEGNPFFLMEMVKALFETGMVHLDGGVWRGDLARISEGELPLPAGVSQAIQARVGRLKDDAQEALRLAAVLGREFDFDLVNVVWDQGEEVTLNALDEMLRRRVIDEGTGAMGRDYAFTHHKIQEVVYAGMPRRRRQHTHGRVGAAMEAHYGPQTEEVVSELAFHYQQAQRLDKTLREKAITYLRRAGEQAVAQFANAEAVSYFSRALDLTPEIDYAERYALLLAREKVYDMQGAREAQSQDLAALKELAEALDDAGRRAEVALRQAPHAYVTGGYPTAISAAQAAIRLAQAAQDVSREAAGYLEWGRTLWRQGDYKAARTRLEQAQARARAARLRQVEAESLRILGHVSFLLSDFAGAGAYGEQALRIFREIGDRWGESMTLNSLGLFLYHRGDYTGGRAYIEQALRVFREIGDRWAEGQAQGGLGHISHDLGDYAGARTNLEQALHIFREVDDRRAEGLMLAHLGLLFHHLGDNETAREYCQPALRIGQKLGDGQAQAVALIFLGHALVGLGRLAEATAAYRQVPALRRKMGMPNWAPDCWAGLARVSLAEGDLTQAQAWVEKILRDLETRTLDNTKEPFRICLTCYHVLRANHDSRAQAILRTAHSLLQERVAKISDEELRRSFLENVAANREIVEAFAKSNG